jgi:hypothetical protein
VTASGGTATLTFTSVGASAMMIRRGTPFAVLLPIPVLALIGAGFGARGAQKKRLLGLFLLWMILAALVIIPACGGSSSGSGGGSSGTPAGNYTITITGKDANGVAQSDTAPAVQIAVN